MTIPELVIVLNKHVKNMEENHNESGEFYKSFVSSNGHKIVVYYLASDYVEISKQNAIEYLDWLNAGNIGKYSEIKKDLTLKL